MNKTNTNLRTLSFLIFVQNLPKNNFFGRDVALTSPPPSSPLPRALARDRAMLATEEMHVWHVTHSSRMAALGPESQHRHRSAQLKELSMLNGTLDARF